MQLPFPGEVEENFHSCLKQEFKSFTSQMRNLELREVKHCIRGHTANWGQGSEAPPGPRPAPLCHPCCDLLCAGQALTCRKRVPGGAGDAHPPSAAPRNSPESREPAHHFWGALRPRAAAQKQVIILTSPNRSWRPCSNVTCHLPASLLRATLKGEKATTDSHWGLLSPRGN